MTLPSVVFGRTSSLFFGALEGQGGGFEASTGRSSRRLRWAESSLFLQAAAMRHSPRAISSAADRRIKKA